MNATSIEWTDFSSQLIRYKDAAGKDEFPSDLRVREFPEVASCR